jgi:hypothetical protein
MATIIMAITVILVYCCALYGWGSLARRFMGVPEGSSPVTIALGLALLIAVGGVLNLARLATAAPLIALVIIGLVLFLLALRRSIRDRAAAKPDIRIISGRAALILIAACVLFFVIATQLPPAAYNIFDDFEKYFAHPKRMLQTGTLFGSPLSALGSETLGGQAFLHGFVLAYFPIQYINGFDAVLALLLCLMLIAGFAWHRPPMIPIAALAMVLLAAINPQYVNISGLYSGSALVLTAVLLTTDPDEYKAWPPSPSALGLVYAGLIALKMSFALFAVLHVLLLSIAVTAITRSGKSGLRWLLAVTAWGIVFLTPWIALHGTHYVTALRDPVAAPLIDELQIGFATVDFLATRTLFYGGSYAYYTGLIAILILCALVTSCSLLSPKGEALRASAAGAFAAAFATAIAYFGFVSLGGPIIDTPENALRYVVPFVLAAVPIMLCVAALHLWVTADAVPMLARAAPPLLVAAVAIASLTPDLVGRLRLALEHGSILAFSAAVTDEKYLHYNQYVLYGADREKITRIQELVPPGAPMVAWISAPFYLDYTRNPIVDAEPAGLATRWARLPPVDYILWEYRGYAVRRPSRYKTAIRHNGRREKIIAMTAMSFAKWLQSQTHDADVLYNDGGMILLRVTH